MSKLHVRHIASKLQELYKDKIDITDGHNEDEKKHSFLTRSFAAYALQILAGTSVETAAMAVIDGRDDNGIDAIYFDKKEKILWLVQSKWIKSGQGEPETGDTSKFKTGVADLIDFELSRFNAKVQAKQQDIEEALNDYEAKINIVLAYTGADSFSTHNQRIIDDLLELINDSSEIASFERFTLSQAHRSLAGIIEGQPIKTEIAIENWGKVETPYKAIYGSVNGSSFAQLWSQHRSRLFSEKCSLSNIDYSVLAKREVGKLWEDINSAPYTDIVNDRLSAIKAWRCISIMNRMALYIKEKSKSISGRERMCLIHSNRFALHLILNHINPQILLDANYDFNTFCKDELPSLIESTERRIFSIVEEHYSQSLVHQVFRNYTKCRDIENKAINVKLMYIE